MVTHQGGSLKFDSSVPLETIEMVMAELKKKFLGTWIDLHVRYAGDDHTHYLAYRYDLGTTQDGLHKQFHIDMIQFMRDVLGADKRNRPNGIHGWSMSRVRASGI
ncbi:MAG: hypothetical protein ACK42D_03200 [Candidatus Paceibacteria bacterium]